MKYLREFESVSAYNTFADGEEYVEPNTSLVTGEGVKYNKARHDYSQDYLTIEIISAGTVYASFDDIYYSKNGEEWKTITIGEDIPTYQSGDIIRIKANQEATYASSSGFIKGTAIFNAYGNPLSLIMMDNFSGVTSLWEVSSGIFNSLFAYSNIISAKNLSLHFTTLASGCYTSMFGGCTGLTTAPELPATTLANNCYGSMFFGCTSLTTAPALPATTLANSCYYQMFEDCTSLTTAPSILPATTLAYECYESMFEGCSSLTTAPELPATTLADDCYENMFNGCTSLNYIKCLATDISADDCTSYWVYNVADTGTFVKNPLMPVYDPDWEDYPEQYWDFYTDGIPEGWTVQDAS